MGWGRTQVYQHGPRCRCALCKDIYGRGPSITLGQLVVILFLAGCAWFIVWKLWL
jgi:hypothetical protein